MNEQLRPNIMLFNLNLGGHYPSYIQHLIGYWLEHKLPGVLNIVVFAEFMEQYSALVNSDLETESNNVRFITITPEEASSLISRKSVIDRVLYRFREWNLFCRYARYLKITHGLLMIFDNFQLPLALGLKSSCSVSGIYFRPSFHYARFNDYKFSLKESLQQLREKLILSQILNNSQFKNLFCLDPFAVKEINKVSHIVKAIYLPDPVPRYQEVNNFCQQNPDLIGDKSTRKVFLLLGTLSIRRGVCQLLDAIRLLSDELCQQICLNLIGQPSSQEEQKKIESRINKIVQSKPVQIIRHYEFISEQKVYAYYNLADVVLAIHQKHIGMSGSLILAAAVQKPVLSSNYGLMGQVVRQHQLGLTVDSTKPKEIAQGLTKFLQASPTKFCDSKKMKAFADQNTAEQFAQVIFQHL